MRTVSVTQAAAVESLTLSDASLDFTAAGETKQLTITSNAEWTATSDMLWLTIDGTTEGTEDEVIDVVAAEQTAAVDRMATITVKTTGSLMRTVSVTQAAAVESLTLSDASLDFTAAGETKQLTITSNAEWTATSDMSWLTISGTAMDTGNGSISVVAAEQAAAVGRMATITVETTGSLMRTVSVTQAAAVESLTLSDASLDFTAAGETKQLTITSNAEWTATSDMSWLTISGTAMDTGNGSISVVAAEQAAAVGRMATITVETTGSLMRTVSVTQAAAVESLTLSDASLDFTAAGETKQLTITSNAEWTATSTATWLTLPTGGTEDEVIDVVAAEQTAAVGRMATITVKTTGGLMRTVSVTQAAAVEALTLSDASLDFTAAGETKPVTITSNAEWTATSDMSWLTISGTAMDTGNGSISVVAAEQAAAVDRMATITVETTGSLMRTVSVTQAAAVEALTLSDASLDFAAAGETKQLTITSNAEWTATSTATWLTLPTGGTEDEVINVVATEQAAAVGRMATITVETTGSLMRTVSVTQAAAVESLTLSDASLDFTAAGETKQLTITSNAEWTATSDMLWLTIDGTTEGTEDEVIDVVAAEQTAAVGRTATITVETTGSLMRTVSVTQAAAVESLTLSDASLDFTAAGETKQLTITSNAEWTATSDMSWLTISGTAMDTGNGSISVVAAEQAAAVDRMATITVETTGSLMRTVSVTQAAAVESLTLSDASLDFTAAGETKQLTITSNAEWTATSTATWLTLPTGGTEDEVINVVATEQAAAVGRMATITVETTGSLMRTVSVTQAAAVESLTLSDASLDFTAAGETKQLTITSNAEWTATSDMLWLTIDGTTEGTEDEVIDVVAAEQTAAVGRTATITVETTGSLMRTVSVTQAAAVESLTLSDASLDFTAAGETKQLTITSNAEWTATSDMSWLTISGTAMDTGNGSISVVAAEQAAAVDRMATITVETTGSLMRTVSVTQAAAVESLTLSDASLDFTAAGETKQLTITSNAEWTATSTATWLTLPTGGTEDEVINVVATEQAAAVGRMATITVETTGSLMRTVSVTQAAAVEALTLSDASLDFTAAGETKQLTITSNAEWTATSDMLWLTIDGTTEGTEDEVIDVVAAEQTAAVGRTATITVETTGSLMRTVSVTQAAAVESLTLSDASLDFTAAGETKQLTITSNAEWTATSDMSWLTISGTAMDTGNGSISVVAAEQAAAVDRMATITVETTGSLMRTVSVTQAAAVESLTLSDASLDFTAAGETKQLTITSNAEWTATSTATWLTLPTGAQRTR